MSTNPSDAPFIDPNYYATEVDRTALRHGVRRMLKVLLGTPEGQEIFSEEVMPEGLPILSIGSTDEEIDRRIKLVGKTFYHGAGSAAMGKVVDTNLLVKGSCGVRICRMCCHRYLWHFIRGYECCGGSQ